jgi:pimeloyl-ACP methyl ester carboxylesterase
MGMPWFGVGRLQQSPDAAGEVALEAADRFSRGLAFVASARDVVARRLVTACAGDDHAVQRGVDLTVAALVEPLALRVARTGVWRDAFEGLLAAEPPLHTGRISAPTLIVWGARDSLLPRADQEAMAAEMPGARLMIYADVGHLPVIEAPERVAADLTALCDAVAVR